MIKADGTQEAPKVEARRVKVFMMKPEDFMSLFVKGFKFHKNATVFEGLPEDAECVGIGSNGVIPGVLLVVQSQEFDPIPVTENPPVVTISINLGNNISQAKKKKGKK